MNKKISKYLIIALMSSVFLSFFSCDYETNYRDADYPDQLIYMPAAFNNGKYVIDEKNGTIGVHPLPGNPYRYVIDEAKKEFRIPLGVYRAGVNNKGAFTVDINVNSEVIATINQGLTTPYLLIPSGKYTLVNSVEMQDGAEIATFDLVVNLDLLRENAPDGIFALGVEISSKQRERNPNLCVTAVIIHTKILE